VIGGMAAGALLTYLLEQGRIDWGQYNYFNSLDQDQRFHRDEFPRDNNYGGYDSHGDDTYSNVDYDNNDFGGNDYSDNGPDGGWV
jgi:hypothetical protein